MTGRFHRSTRRSAPAPGNPGAGRVWVRVVPPLLLGVGVTLMAVAGPTAPVASAAQAFPARASGSPPSWQGHPTFRDGPPARVSGGFGEETCIACHFGSAAENDPSGGLEIAGVPEGYTPGESYTVTVTLTRPGMVAGGFQLTSRFQEDGRQAGELSPGENDQARVGFTTEREVVYAHHLLPGITPTAADANRWTLRWKAPESGGTVVFHLVGVAGDGDESQFGDYVFTATAKSATSN